MDKADYGIRDALPQLKDDKVKAIKQRIEDEGVPDEITLTDLKKEDLMKDGLLKQRAAEKLVEYWKTSQYKVCLCVNQLYVWSHIKTSEHSKSKRTNI